MLANYLIGLREGLEAALVVCILVAYLVRTGRRDGLPAIWAGVAGAITLSLVFGAVLTFTSRRLSFEQQETFGGVMSIIAVGFVTWMVFWMRRTARHLRADLDGRMDRAVGMGTLALAVTATIAVGREGLETSLFIWAAVQSSGSGVTPAAGATLGLLTAVVLGHLFYRGAVRINLAKFFLVTGAGLIVVAAGVFSYGVHDLQEAGLLPGLNAIAYDVSQQVPPGSWYGVLLKGTLNFSPVASWLEVWAWLGYLVPVGLLFLRPQPARPTLPATA